jgi:alkaline phosphatase D
MRATRRDFLATFLKGAGCWAVAAALPLPPRVLAAAADAPPRARRHRFPQGIASGDPTPTSVVLRTRVEAADGARGAIPLTVHVSDTPDFARVVAERTVTATADADHTVRVLVTGLAPDTRYHYRFVAGAAATGDHTGPAATRGDASPAGRTRTAPPADADRPIRLAFASCQAYEAGFYGGWRTLVNEDAARPDGEQLDFVLHLGDFVYEALGYGAARRVPPLPSGGAPVGTGNGKEWAERHAVTLEDYRHLYRTYLADPDLQAARARFAFVVTWDDHEFSDDCWQGVSTYAVRGAPAQTRRAAANQAWFEFIPALLTGAPDDAPDGVPNEAHDWRPARVGGAAVRDAALAARDDDGFYREPNNVAAVESLAIYRRFRWGRHVDLVVTDARSYRSEHCVPGELGTRISGTARYLIPVSVARTFDAGRTANGGAPPAQLTLAGKAIPNVRRDAPPGTILGARQKRWFKQAMRASGATWKLWANSVPLMPMRFDLAALDPARMHDAVFTVDTWEGYATERAELLGFLRAEGVANVVSLTGDNHNHFAGVVHADPDVPSPDAVAAEVATCGVSSTSVWQGLRGAVEQRGGELAALVSWRPPGAAEPVPALNLTWLWGARAAATLARTNDLARARTARSPRQNPHLRYVDSSANGFALATAYADRLEATLVTTEAPTVDRGAAGARVVRRAHLVVPARTGTMPAELAVSRVEGPPPFPMDATGA